MSKKKRERKERRLQEKALSEVRHSQERLLKRALKVEPGEAQPIVIRERQEIRKMSEILLDFAGPFFVHARSHEDYEKVLLLVTAAWNISLLSAGARAHEITKFGEATGSPHRLKEIQEILQKMIDRKEKLFPNIRRLVLDWDYLKTPQGAHLNVVSSPLQDSDADQHGIDQIEQLLSKKKTASLG